MTGLAQRWAILWVLCLQACTGSQATGPAPKAPQASPVGPDLPGRWARYWSTTGRVDTECYVFEATGRFHWRQAEGSTATVTHRSGTWRHEGEALALTVEHQRTRTGAEGDVDQHMTLPLGPCPKNPEARAMDASYACISIDGKAFFRQR